MTDTNPRAVKGNNGSADDAENAIVAQIVRNNPNVAALGHWGMEQAKGADTGLTLSTQTIGYAVMVFVVENAKAHGMKTGHDNVWTNAFGDTAKTAAIQELACKCLIADAKVSAPSRKNGKEDKDAVPAYRHYRKLTERVRRGVDFAIAASCVGVKPEHYNAELHRFVPPLACLLPTRGKDTWRLDEDLYPDGTTRLPIDGECILFAKHGKATELREANWTLTVAFVAQLAKHKHGAEPIAAFAAKVASREQANKQQEQAAPLSAAKAKAQAQADKSAMQDATRKVPVAEVIKTCAAMVHTMVVADTLPAASDWDSLRTAIAALTEQRDKLAAKLDRAKVEASRNLKPGDTARPAQATTSAAA